jgi:RNA ligase (TIGR02306 family)
MPIVDADGRKLVTVETVLNVSPIVDADKIEVARVRGWDVVVAKDEVHPGDKVIYVEVDTALPIADERVAFLANRSVKNIDGEQYHVLRTARIRGAYSQGLILPLERFAPLDTPEGTDLTEKLGWGKWEAPPPVVKQSHSPKTRQNQPFLTQYARKTDAERIQNLTRVWDVIKQHRWIATLKVDGTSATVCRDEYGNLRVMSRNWEVQDDGNTYWNIVHRYQNIFDLLQPYEAIQFEIAGPNIQSNRMKLSEVRPYIFGANLGGRRHVPLCQWPQKLLDFAVPVLDLTLPETVDAAIEQVEGLRWGPNNVLAEGIVWHEADGNGLEVLDGRSVFKVINNQYLLKN